MAAAHNLKLASPLGFLHVGVENGGLLKGSGKAFDGIICTCFSGQQLKEATTAATLHIKSHRRKVCSPAKQTECVSSDDLLYCAAATALTILSLIYALFGSRPRARSLHNIMQCHSLSLSLTHTLITNIYCSLFC